VDMIIASLTSELLSTPPNPSESSSTTKHLWPFSATVSMGDPQIHKPLSITTATQVSAQMNPNSSNAKTKAQASSISLFYLVHRYTVGPTASLGGLATSKLISDLFPVRYRPATATMLTQASCGMELRISSASGFTEKESSPWMSIRRTACC